MVPGSRRTRRKRVASIEPISYQRVTVRDADGRVTKQRVPLPKRDWRWKVRYRDPNGRTREKTFDRQVDARRWLELNASDMTRGEWTDPALQRTRFSDWADEWWETTVKLQPLTRRGYRIMLDGHVLPYFGNRALMSIDYLTVERFIAEKVKEGIGPKKIRDIVSVVSLVMRTAVRAGARKDNPAAGHEIRVRRRKLAVGEMLDMTSIQALVDGTRDPYKPAVWLLALLGLRPAELCGLRVSSVDFVRRTVTVSATLTPVHAFENHSYQLVEGPPKTDAGHRTIPVPEWLIEDLSVMLAARARLRGRAIERSDWLFESPQGGKPLNRDDLRRRVIVPALVAAGLPTSFRTYDLRHAHASLLIDAGASPLDVAHRMGHTDPAVTLRNYGHLFDGRQEELTRRIDDLRRDAAARAPARRRDTGRVSRISD